jgi:hypothetical protein
MYAWRDFLSWAFHEAFYNEIEECRAYGIYRGKNISCDGSYSAILLKGSYILIVVQMLHLLCQFICS